MRFATALGVLAFWCALVAAPVTATAAPVRSPDRPSLSLVSLDPWVQATDTVTATLRTRGVPQGSTLETVLYRAVPTRSAFALTMQGRNLGGVEARPAPRPLDATAGTVAVQLAVNDGSAPPGPLPVEDAVTLTRPGVYPLVFSVRDDKGQVLVSLVCYIVRLPVAPPTGASGRQPLRVASLFRLQPRPEISATGQLVLSRSARNSTDALLTGLADVSDPVRESFGFTVSPSLLDTYATNRSSADRSAHQESAQPLSALATLTDGLPLQPQPWSPLDPAGWLATGDLAGLVGPAADRGNAALEGHLHTPDATTTDLASWGGRISDESLQWFAGRGTSLFFVPEGALSDLDSSAYPRTLAAPFDLDIGRGRTVPAMQLDRGLAAHFTGDDPVLGANQLIADLSVIALDLPSISRAMVVAPPPGWKPNAAFLTAYSAGLAGARPTGAEPLVAPTPIAKLGETPPARSAGDTATGGPVLQRSLRRTTPPTPLTDLGNEMSRTGSDVASMAAMLPGGAARTRLFTRQLREQMSIAAMPGVPAARRADAFRAVRAQARQTAASLRLPPRQTITLTANTAALPVSIRRAVDGPRKVLVHIDAPSRLHFPQGRTQAVNLAEPTTRFDIHVRSDSPGDSIVRLTVTSPDSRLVAGTTELVVRSTAASGVGLVISLGSLVFLVLWWGRDIVRTRRRRRARHVPPAQLIDIGTTDDSEPV